MGEFRVVTRSVENFWFRRIAKRFAGIVEIDSLLSSLEKKFFREEGFFDGENGVSA